MFIFTKQIISEYKYNDYYGIIAIFADSLTKMNKKFPYSYDEHVTTEVSSKKFES